VDAIMTEPTTETSDATVVARAERAIERMSRVREAIGRVVFGQEEVVERALVTLLSGGHGLLVGVPGLAKTRLVETLGVVLGLDTRRIQFTPDLMPSDILGSEVLDQAPDGARSFRFVKGPVFTRLLMADEINRASPRTQSALLQAMQEAHVTIAGVRHDLPRPFHVLATQNPLEQEGTYPLPEAQLDRFLMQIDVDWPDLATERRILLETTGASETKPEPVLGGDELMDLQALVRLMPVGDGVVDAILALVRSARPAGPPAPNDPAAAVAWGPGPRAGQALMLTVRARALLQGRLAPDVGDVIALAEPILQHRMALTFAARADGVGVRDVVARLTARIG
jgi:MoxR-like ATPase